MQVLVDAAFYSAATRMVGHMVGLKDKDLDGAR